MCVVAPLRHFVVDAGFLASPSCHSRHFRLLPDLASTGGRRLDWGMGMRFLDSRAILSIEEKLGCGFWRRDVGADEMEWSRGLFRLYGLDPAKDRPSYTLMRGTQHPEDRLTFDKIDGNVRAGTLFDRQYRVVLPCGSTRNLAHRGEVIFDSSGNPAFDVAVVWNVDERTQLLDEVLADERRIKVILEALDYFIAFLRSDGLSTCLGPSLARLLETSGFAADRVLPAV